MKADAEQHTCAWMVGAAARLNLPDEATHLAVELFRGSLDRPFAKGVHAKTIACACLLIADKCDSQYTNHVDDIVFVANDAATTSKDVLNTEIALLVSLDFRVAGVPTALRFLDDMFGTPPSALWERWNRHAGWNACRYFAELSLVCPGMESFPPRLRAIASAVAAHALVDERTTFINQALPDVEEDLLRSCVEAMLDTAREKRLERSVDPDADATDTPEKFGRESRMQVSRMRVKDAGELEGDLTHWIRRLCNKTI